MTNTPTVPADRVIGSIYGLAYGDAIGDPTEFRSYSEIRAAGGASVPDRLRITDDTQMSLAVWYALDDWDGSSLGALRLELAATFGAWATDPDNNRAPGVTCLSSLSRLGKLGVGRWALATSATSAGCGSVMRAPWVGLHPRVTDDALDAVAMLQAVLTHGPAENAYCAAALAGLTRALARDEVAPGHASAWLDRWVAARVGSAYDEAALGNLYRLVHRTDDRGDGRAVGSREEYVAEGLRHVSWVANAARLLSDRLTTDPWGFDPCAVAGEGWRAREAMAVAVGILDGFAAVAPALPELTLLRAAETNGDSDSIGAITGALVGAAIGDGAWPADFEARLERRYSDELAAVVGDVLGAHRALRG